MYTTKRRKDTSINNRDTTQSFFNKKGKNLIQKTKSFTPVSIPKESLISIIKEKYRVQDPIPMRAQTLPTRDKSKYCGFHQDYGHTTGNYIQLKRAIERFIQEGVPEGIHFKHTTTERQERKSNQYVHSGNVIY